MYATVIPGVLYESLTINEQGMEQGILGGIKWEINIGQRRLMPNRRQFPI